MNKKKNRTNKGARLAAILCVCLLSVLLLGGCMGLGGGDDPPPSGAGSGGDSSQESSDSPESSEPAVSELEQRILQKLSSMTLEEKAAQLFIITPDALAGQKNVTAADETTRKALQATPVGGLIYFGENIVGPEQLKTMTENTQRYARETQGMPLLLAVDEEGGAVARLGNNRNFALPKFPDMADIGAQGDVQKAYEVGAGIGGYLREYGLNLDFAPDADVLTNPGNTVIGKRSFGTDGKLVADMALEVARGLADQGVLSCFKHFPGHGGTKGDTHEGFAYTDRTLEELRQSELVPFQAAVDAKIPFIMISHIAAPQVTGDNTPASLSGMMMTDLLRTQMGYEGIIITDALGMGAITETYGAKEAAVQSLLAGADLLLMPEDFGAAYQGVLDAVADGTLSTQRIDASLERILRVKLAL